MTLEEANIAFKKQLLVTMIESISNPDLKGGIYRINEIGKFYNRRLKTFDEFVVIVSDNERTAYRVGPENVKPMPGYELIINQMLERKHKLLAEQCTVASKAEL